MFALSLRLFNLFLEIIILNGNDFINGAAVCVVYIIFYHEANS